MLQKERCPVVEHSDAGGDQESAAPLPLDFDGMRYLAVPGVLGGGSCIGKRINISAVGACSVRGSLLVDAGSYLVLAAEGTASQPSEHAGLLQLLSQREIEIAILVSHGKVNKQIAHQLMISEYTVSTHMRRIFCKLGVSSRAAMVACLMDHLMGR